MSKAQDYTKLSDAIPNPVYDGAALTISSQKPKSRFYLPPFISSSGAMVAITPFIAVIQAAKAYQMKEGLTFTNAIGKAVESEAYKNGKVVGSLAARRIFSKSLTAEAMNNVNKSTESFSFAGKMAAYSTAAMGWGIFEASALTLPFEVKEVLRGTKTLDEKQLALAQASGSLSAVRSKAFIPAVARNMSTPFALLISRETQKIVKDNYYPEEKKLPFHTAFPLTFGASLAFAFISVPFDSVLQRTVLSIKDNPDGKRPTIGEIINQGAARTWKGSASRIAQQVVTNVALNLATIFSDEFNKWIDENEPAKTKEKAKNTEECALCREKAAVKWLESQLKQQQQNPDFFSGSDKGFGIVHNKFSEKSEVPSHLTSTSINPLSASTQLGKI